MPLHVSSTMCSSSLINLIKINLCALKEDIKNFDVLLTVHLSIFILFINQLDAQHLFYNKFISCLYMF